MKTTISTLLAVSALILAFAVPAAPISAQEWNADNLPTGSNAWWKAMDREGQDGRPNN